MSATVTKPRRRSIDPVRVRDDAPAVQFAAAPPPTGTHTLNLTVSALLRDWLAESARQARQSVDTFAAQLLRAAYVAQHRPTGVSPLDDVVARTVILSRDHNTAEIATAVGLGEASVTRILAAWRDAAGAGA